MNKATAVAAIMMGQILQAHNARRKARDRAKATHKNLEAADRDMGTFGRYEDCGDSYHSMYYEARGAHGEAVQNKITAEKTYKALKHQFIEAYPDMVNELDEALAIYTKSIQDG